MRLTSLILVALVCSATFAGAAERERAILLGGMQRSYILVAPDMQSHAAPLLIVYHGGGDSPQRALGYTRFDKLARSENVVVVFPQGIDSNWNDGRVTNDIRQRASAGVDDVAFTLAIIDQLAAENIIDPARVFLTGASNGGLMALRTACSAAERIAGIAPVVANQPADWQCEPSRPIPAMFFNGTEDEFMPFKGGRIAEHKTRKDLGTVESVEDTIAEFSRIDGCTGVKKTETRDERESDQTKAIVTDYECSKAPLRQVVIEGGGHTWPGARTGLIADMVLGRTTPEIDATKEIWEFFKSLPAR